MSKPQLPRELPKDWEWTERGLRAWDEESERFDASLWSLWIGKTRARGSQTLDEPEVRDSSRILLVKQDEPRWKLPSRIVALVVSGLGFLAVREAATIVSEDPYFATLVSMIGVAIVVGTTVLMETVLRR